MKLLNIQITAECDLRCPWCIEYSFLRETSGVITQQAFERLMLHIKATPYSSYAIQGGEALLYTDETFSIIDAIKQEQPDAHILLNTNATHLTEETVVKLKDRDVSVTISLEAEGYKGIKHLVNKALEPEKVITNINTLNTLTIRSVNTNITDFAQGVLALHAVFPRARIESVLDLNKLSTITSKDMHCIKENIEYLKSRTHDLKWLSMPRAFNGGCKDENYKYFFLTNEIQDQCPLTEKAKDGCTAYITAMGQDTYNEYRKIIQEMEICH